MAPVDQITESPVRLGAIAAALTQNRPQGGAAAAGEGFLPADPAMLDVLHGEKSPQEILRVALKDVFAGRTALVSSFGAESAVLLHMVAEIDPATPVIFLDTLRLFGETLRYRDRLVAHLGLTDVRIVTPAAARLAAGDPEDALFGRDSDLCCHIRKTEPMDRALKGFGAWITGRKRFQAASRKAVPVFEADGESGRVKINPLASWTAYQLRDYMLDHDLPRHPLVEDGYLSIGCMPCTDRVQPGEDPRAGRWRGKDKIECGIHVNSPANGGATIAMAAEDTMDIYRNGGFETDMWTAVADGTDLPAGPALVSATRWAAERDILGERNAPLGVIVEPGDRVEALAPDLERFPVIAIAFPKFGDGRGYSHARLLREKYGYTGELRAVGNVLIDQIPLMARVGINAYTVTHEPTRRRLIEGRVPGVNRHYQPAAQPEAPAGTRPWQRRSGPVTH